MSGLSGKVIVVGGPSVGKTCLIQRAVSRQWYQGRHETVLVDKYDKSVRLDATSEKKLFIYEATGRKEKEFADKLAPYYRVAQVCLLCIDMSTKPTFDDATWWMEKVREFNDKCSFILVGTKGDLAGDGSETELVTAWCEERDIQFFQTSALNEGAAINFLFHTVAEKCAMPPPPPSRPPPPEASCLPFGSLWDLLRPPRQPLVLRAA